MGFVKGLKGIKQHVDAEDAKFAKRGDSDTQRATWFKIKDKQTVKILFLQELDPDAPNYSEKNGLGVLAVEHVNPKNYRRKALCSIEDEGLCWACEEHAKDWKAGWKQKSKLYINVLVDNGTDEPFVAILSQGFGPKSITPLLLEFAQGDEDADETPSITDKWFKVKRNGSGVSDTSYILMPGAASKENVEDYELFDLEKAVRNVPYAQQEAHYLDGEAEDEVAAEAAAESSKERESVSAEW